MTTPKAVTPPKEKPIQKVTGTSYQTVERGGNSVILSFFQFYPEKGIVYEAACSVPIEP